MASSPDAREALRIASEKALIVSERIRLAALSGVTQDPMALAFNEHAAGCWQTYATLLKEAADGAG